MPDNSVDVHSDVKLSNRLPNLSKLTNLIVDGDFDISENELTSFRRSPTRVGGSFLLKKWIKLSSLWRSKEVKGSFVILHNNITSLQNSNHKRWSYMFS